MSDITHLIGNITSRAMLDRNRLELVRALGAAQLRRGGEWQIKAIIFAYANMIERLYIITPRESKTMALEELDKLAHIADFYDVWGEQAETYALTDNDSEGKGPVRKFYRQAVKNLDTKPLG